MDFLAENEEALVGETKEELEDQFSDVFTAEEIGFEQELPSCVIDDVIERLQAEDGKEAKDLPKWASWHLTLMLLCNAKSSAHGSLGVYRDCMGKARDSIER